MIDGWMDDDLGGWIRSMVCTYPIIEPEIDLDGRSLARSEIDRSITIFLLI